MLVYRQRTSVGFDEDDEDTLPRRVGVAGIDRPCPAVGTCAELEDRECFARVVLNSWRQAVGDKSPKSKERGRKQKNAVKAKNDKGKAERIAAKAKKL
ncbi:MAG: hypothetical protein JW940_00965 [Polyangiaceae bacterium]|nr:hypothetical protein [Polyangiaceae bacterium]